jgi:hypothetical protein
MREPTTTDPVTAFADLIRSVAGRPVTLSATIDGRAFTFASRTAAEDMPTERPVEEPANHRRPGRKRGMVYPMALAVLADDGGTMTEGEILAEFASRAKRHRRWNVPEATIRGALRNLVADGDIFRGPGGVGFCLEGET